MKISQRYIIGIKEFLNNYILSKKDFENEKIGKSVRTHNQMNLCLFENGYSVPDRVKLKEVSKNDILSGEVIIVMDKTGQVIAYRNPKRVNITLLEQELNSVQNKKKALKERRNYLKSIGYVETKNGEVIEKALIDEIEDTITYKINRNKVLTNRYGKKGVVGLK